MFTLIEDTHQPERPHSVAETPGRGLLLSGWEHNAILRWYAPVDLFCAAAAVYWRCGALGIISTCVVKALLTLARNPVTVKSR